MWLYGGRVTTLAMASAKAETLCKAQGWLIKNQNIARTRITTRASCDGTPASPDAPTVNYRCHNA